MRPVLTFKNPYSMAKITLEILHIFRRNIGLKQLKLQNRPKFVSHVGLLHNYLQHNNKYCLKLRF